MRTRSIALLALLVPGLAAAQSPVSDPLPPPPPDDPVVEPAPEPAPPPTPEPTPEPDPVPTAEPSEPPEPTEPSEPAPPAEPAGTKVEARRVVDRGVVLGFEAGFGGAGGTSSTVYGAGFGTGFVVGYRYLILSLEWHFRHSYALTAKESALRGTTTQGELSSSAVLARVRLYDKPMLEVMAGPAVLSAPVLVIGEDYLGDPLIEAQPLRGLGLVVGGAVGYRVSHNFAIGLDVRAVVAARWELPGHVYVVPGDRTADGGVMYTEAREDASATPWTATVLMRLLL